MGIEPIAEEVNIKINAFGSTHGQNLRLKEYEVVLKPLDRSCSIYVKALAIPEICGPVCNQHVKLATDQNEFLRALKLADDGEGNLKEVDILIGADVYWQKVSGNLKNAKTGLVAVSSWFGWLLNGPVQKDTVGETETNTNLSHVLRAQCETSEDKMLSENISRFWRLDLIGVAEEELSADHEDICNVIIKDGRYSVELPFKKSHPIIPDNLSLCQARLRKLRERLDKNEDLKKKYDNVMEEQLKCGVIEVTDPGAVGCVTYLPHREVIREDRSTTKISCVRWRG